MTNIHNSLETLNAAATAIVTAESRVQPSSVQKRRWTGKWNLSWCFGSCKQYKQIGHAVFVPEPIVSTSAPPSTENSNRSTSIILPFIAPPSSPASFLQSDPPSSTQTPAGLLSLKSLSGNGYPTSGTASIFTIGPYAYETQLVSPPVFSAGATEPSTAAYTPPPESVQPTAPSSPEVPFSQLLASSFARNRRNSKPNLKYSLSQYEFQPYQYPGSPGDTLKSPSSVSISGTSSPYPDKLPVYEFRMIEGSKFIGYDHFTTHKWGSRMGSGSLTPNGGVSGTLTPVSQGIYLLESQIPEIDQEIVIDHRVSFELINEIQTGLSRTMSEPPSTIEAESTLVSKQSEISSEAVNENPGEVLDGEMEKPFDKRRTITLGSSKDFDFDNTEKEGVLDKSVIECEWWKTENFSRNDNIGSDNDWTFFPVLQPEVS